MADTGWVRRVSPAVSGPALLAFVLATSMVVGLVVGADRTAARASAPALPAGSTTSPPPDTHVAVIDFRFDPSTVPIARGGTVIFDFDGPSHHTATDSSGLGLYDSGSVGPGGPSTSFTFQAAGVYPFTCTPHPFMGGRVTVPMRVAPGSGGVHRTFTATWAAADASDGRVYDVQIRRPGRVWKAWRTGVTVGSDVFTSGAGKGRYRFRARMRDAALGEASRWSSSVAVEVG
jgi:plastocyanin